MSLCRVSSLDDVVESGRRSCDPTPLSSIRKTGSLALVDLALSGNDEAARRHTNFLPTNPWIP